jgi:hypothetical protein
MRRFTAVLFTLTVALSFVSPAAAGNTIRLYYAGPIHPRQMYSC